MFSPLKHVIEYCAKMPTVRLYRGSHGLLVAGKLGPFWIQFTVMPTGKAYPPNTGARELDALEKAALSIGYDIMGHGRPCEAGRSGTSAVS